MGMVKYAHCNIISTDWKKLADFYINVFDCKIKPPIRKQSGSWLAVGTGVPQASLEGAHLTLPGYGEDGPTLEIYQYADVIPNEGMAPNSRGLGHLAFEVENLPQVIDRVELHGGKLYGQISSNKVSGVGIITFVYAQDPDDNFIEIQQWKKE